MKKIFLLLILGALATTIFAQLKPRARALGVPFDGSPGEFNAITDVKGVEVGYTTLVSGTGDKAVRTGVTAILPQGKNFSGRLFAAWQTLNGNGEMTGTTWIEESGGLGSPILITNTHSVGIVRDAVIEWGAKKFTGGGYSGDFSLPVVAETWDGFLNDINGFHVKKEHVFSALDSAKTGSIAEATSAAEREWSPTDSRQEPVPRHGFWKPASAATPSAYSSRRTTARGNCSPSLAFL